MNRPTALIADDEEHLVTYLEAHLKLAWPELLIVGKAGNGLEALRLMDELVPDIAFLDIRMPGLTGLEVALRFDSKSATQIVFTTAYDQYALDAFETSAVDYLLKPITDDRLAKTVSKLKQNMQKHNSSVTDIHLHNLLSQLQDRLSLTSQNTAPFSITPAPSKTHLQWIRAALGAETRLIPIEEVIYFQSNDKYTCVITADGESLIRTPLRELVEQLDDTKFWQIHRSTVVCAKQIAGTKTDFRGRLIVKLKNRKDELVVSRNYVDLFKQM